MVDQSDHWRKRRITGAPAEEPENALRAAAPGDSCALQAHLRSPFSPLSTQQRLGLGKVWQGLVP